MQDYIIKNCLHFIGGEYTSSRSKQEFNNTASCDGSVLGTVARGGADDINIAVEVAQFALASTNWKSMTFAERAVILNRVADLIDSNRELLAKMESIDTGKPISESLTGDILRAASNFRFFAQLSAKQKPQQWQSEDGSTHQSLRQPIGVVGLITPWNLPLYLESWKIAPALAQGNAVVLKPAELTPMTATALGEIMNEAGVPAGIFNVVHGFGPGEAGEALVTHPDVKAISFTGETVTGSAIMAAAAPHLKKLSFELGGKGASVVFADADLEKAAETATRAAFRNQGQICLAGSRLLVEESVADRCIELIEGHIKKIKLGHPLDAETTMGSLISHEHRDKVAAYVAKAVSKGASVVCGGKIPTTLTEGAYYEPTLISGLSDDAEIATEEVFGPVLTVQRFKSREHACTLLNQTPYGLSCSIWSESQETQHYMAEKADTGLVWQNSWFLRDLNTAFGGMKRSGIGREGGEFSLDFFSEYKTISTPAKEN